MKYPGAKKIIGLKAKIENAKMRIKILENQIDSLSSELVNERNNLSFYKSQLNKREEKDDPETNLNYMEAGL